MAITLDGTNGVTTPDLTVDTNTLKVDATNNRVGVGNASPSDVLHIRRTDGTTVGNVLNIDNSAGSSTHGAVTNGIRVVSDNNGYWANLRVQGHSTLFDPQGSGTKVRIDSDGLKFGTDTAAANALDDYEEGTFTPIFQQGLSSAGYSTQIGTYIKIGRQVICSIQLRATSGTENSSHIYVGGLPFTITNDVDHSFGAFWTYNGGFWTSSANTSFLGLRNTTNLAFYKQVDGGAIVGTHSDVANNLNADLRIVVVYRAD